MEFYAKKGQHGTTIDANIQQKSMPKLVMKKIRKIIKIHVSLNGKSIEIYCEKQVFLIVQTVACANGKGIKQTSEIEFKYIQKSMKNRYKYHA